MKNAVFLLLFPLFSMSAQSVNDLYKQSMQAYEAKDYTTFLMLNKKMDSIRPMHPAISYNLAAGYTLNGDNGNAFTILKQIALADSKVSVESDGDFKAFTATKSYVELEKIRKNQDIPVANSRQVVTLAEKMLHPEGLEYVDGTGWLTASIRKRKITVFDIKTGTCADWLSGNDMLAVFSLKKSRDGLYLWAATAAIPEMENFSASLEGKAEVLKIEVATRKIVQRFAVAGNHVFGDLVIAPSEEVYVSDSGKPILYRISNDTMEEWLNLEKEAFNLQGIALDMKGARLFVADYLTGIIAISIKDKSRYRMLFPDNATQKGIDGLLYHENSLIAIHNGVSPIRIIQYHLSPKTNRIESFTVHDNNRTEFNEPVLGTIYKGNLYFFGNSPWKAYGRDFNPDESKATPPALFMLKLKK